MLHCLFKRRNVGLVPADGVVETELNGCCVVVVQGAHREFHGSTLASGATGLIGIFVLTSLPTSCANYSKRDDTDYR